jgi:hypothetical protein
MTLDHEVWLFTNQARKEVSLPPALRAGVARPIPAHVGFTPTRGQHTKRTIEYAKVFRFRLNPVRRMGSPH